MQEDASHCRLREVADKSARERQVVERLWADLPFHPLRLKRLHLRLGYSQAILNPYLGLGIEHRKNSSWGWESTWGLQGARLLKNMVLVQERALPCFHM